MRGKMRREKCARPRRRKIFSAHMPAKWNVFCKTAQARIDNDKKNNRENRQPGFCFGNDCGERRILYKRRACDMFRRTKWRGMGVHDGLFRATSNRRGMKKHARKGEDGASGQELSHKAHSCHIIT